MSILQKTSDFLVAIFLLAFLSAAAVWFVHTRGYTLYYGDAEAHLNHARRIVDSRTPGADELGVVWLPLPHLLMIPFVTDDRLWRSGLAGAIPSAACFVLSGALLFASVKAMFGSSAAGFAAAGSLGFNPNLLYLQSTPMNEPIFLSIEMALLYCTVRFRQTQSPLLAIIAGIAAAAGSLTRYEGWFLIPFLAIYILVVAKRRKLLITALFCVLAISGPIAWLAHNFWYTGDALSFYRGPGSPMAIQGSVDFPGHHNWAVAWLQFRSVARLVVGRPLLWMAIAGAIGALARKAIWPLLLLSLPPVFYILNLHSGASPIFVPTQWPFSYYNTRYGLTMLPLAAFAVAGLIVWTPERLRVVAVVAVVGASLVPWLTDPRMDNVVTWKESQINSVARRAWTRQAADFLRTRYRPGSGVFTTFGDISGIFRQAGIPLHDTLTWDNWPVWPAAVARPELFLREEWAVALGDDPVQSAINRAFSRGPRYTLLKTISVKDAPLLAIYRRDSQPGAGNEFK